MLYIEKLTTGFNKGHEKCCNVLQTTHPVCASLDHPLSACGGKRDRKIRLFPTRVIARRNDVAIPDIQSVSVSRGLPRYARNDVILYSDPKKIKNNA
jgi:hypothetical protein